MKALPYTFIATAVFFFAAIPTYAAYEIEGTFSTQGGVVPQAPEEVSAELLLPGGTEIEVTWSAVLGAEGYNLYRGQTSEGFSFLASTTATSYVDSSLTPGNSYSYLVQPFTGTLLNQDYIDSPTNLIAIEEEETNEGNNEENTGGSSSGGGGGSSGGGGGGGGGSPVPQTSTLSPEAEEVDVNSDGKIDVLDFNQLLIDWGGSSGGSGLSTDFNGDGTVDILDFNQLLINWTG
ncbi:MAG: dockerin type I domain-containing protein [Candidatus Paceibacterota bacterium]